ncbi:hypothetical protein GTV15_01285 [Streptomyces sp. SID7803]|nr:hypothetical protein [Streptomyces sp. SID7803]
MSARQPRTRPRRWSRRTRAAGRNATTPRLSTPPPPARSPTARAGPTIRCCRR